MNFNVEILMEIFEYANNKFLEKDLFLFETDVSERSWYTRMAIYLTEKLNEFNSEYIVDTEYNRNMGKVKTIFDESREMDIIKITCDIIIHSRGKNKLQDNLLCIEMKKSNIEKDKKLLDKRRLEVLTRTSYDDIWSADGKTLPKHVCGYLLGIYYEVNINTNKIIIEYYSKGKLIEERVVNIKNKYDCYGDINEF